MTSDGLEKNLVKTYQYVFGTRLMGSLGRTSTSLALKELNCVPGIESKGINSIDQHRTAWYYFFAVSYKNEFLAMCCDFKGQQESI